MKLVTFIHNNQNTIGSIVGSEVVSAIGYNELPQTMPEFLSIGDQALVNMQRLIDSGKNRHALAEVKLLAPMPRPGKYLDI